MRASVVMVSIVSGLAIFALLTINAPPYTPSQPYFHPIISHTVDQFVNATTARSLGIQGYMTTIIENHSGVLTIPATGNLTVTVDLWFVSYDNNITETVVTVNPKVSYGGGEWLSFAAACEPNGYLTVRVNEPTWLRVTLWIPEYVGHGIGIGGNYGADLVDVRSSYTIIGTDYSLENWTPRVRATPENVTTQDEVVLSIFNPGPSLISLYYAYDLARLENGTWTPVSLDSTWSAIDIVLKSGESWSQLVSVKGLPPGLYRVSKTVEWMGADRVLSTQFSIIR